MCIYYRFIYYIHITIATKSNKKPPEMHLPGQRPLKFERGNGNDPNLPGLRVPGDAFQVSTLEAHDAMVKFGSMPQ